MNKFRIITICLLLIIVKHNYAQFTPVGSGSYSTVFPGVDEANRNTYPSGTPYVSGDAANVPVPTNDWWSSKVKEPHVNNLFNYPLALATKSGGLLVSYIEAPSGANGSSQPMDDQVPILVGVESLNASKSTVAGFSDFTVTMNWTNSSHDFNATVGIAMPFIYFSTCVAHFDVSNAHLAN